MVSDTWWVCGPPGVGKSSVGWQVWRAGLTNAFVDIDQLGMRYPSTPGDPDRHRLKLDVLAALRGALLRRGVQRIIVSGVVGDAAATRRALPGVHLIRLRADDADLRLRLMARDGTDGLPSDVGQEAKRLDREFDADVVIDTTGRSIDQVIDDTALSVRTTVAADTGADPVASNPLWSIPLRPGSDSPGGRRLLLHGSRAAGASTIGFEWFSQRVAAGATAAFLDTRQLGFLRAHDETRAHLDAIRAVAAQLAGGDTDFIAVGRVADPQSLRDLTDALGGASPIRVRADPLDLASHVRARVAGGPPHLAGDDLRGTDPAAATRDALADGALLDSVDLGPTLDVTGRSVSESVAALNTQLADKPPRGHP